MSPIDRNDGAVDVGGRARSKEDGNEMQRPTADSSPATASQTSTVREEM